MQKFNTAWIEDHREGRNNKWRIDNVLTFMHQQRTTTKVSQELVTLPSNSEDFINKLKGWTPSPYNVRDFQRACINIVNNACLPDESKDALIKELVTAPFRLGYKESVIAMTCVVVYDVALLAAREYAKDHNHENSTQFTALLNNDIYFLLMIHVPLLLVIGLLKTCYKPSSISDSDSQFMEAITNVVKEIDRINRDSSSRARATIGV